MAFSVDSAYYVGDVTCFVSVVLCLARTTVVLSCVDCHGKACAHACWRLEWSASPEKKLDMQSGNDLLILCFYN